MLPVRLPDPARAIAATVGLAGVRVPGKRRKRVRDEAREEGLAAARELLLTEGPSAVTVAGVGRRIGMSHTNVIHHFGSASDLQDALMASMIQDLTAALGEAIDHIRSDAAAPKQVVEKVFDAFAAGGAGHLAAWIALNRGNHHLTPVRDAVRGLVEAIREKVPGEEDKIRAAVLLLAICAFGDAVIGSDLRSMLDKPDHAVRAITARALLAFLVAPGGR